MSTESWIRELWYLRVACEKRVFDDLRAHVRR